MGVNPDGSKITLADKFDTGIAAKFGDVGDLVSLGFFILLAVILFRFATSKEAKSL